MVDMKKEEYEELNFEKELNNAKRELSEAKKVLDEHVIIHDMMSAAVKVFEETTPMILDKMKVIPENAKWEYELEPAYWEGTKILTALERQQTLYEFKDKKIPQLAKTIKAKREYVEALSKKINKLEGDEE